MEYNKTIVINGLKMIQQLLKVFNLTDFVKMLDAAIHIINKYENDDTTIWIYDNH